LCYEYTSKIEGGKETKEEKLAELRSLALRWPRSKVPWGVEKEDMEKAEKEEECPEDLDVECYCVAFFMKNERRLVNIRPSGLRAITLGV